MAQPRAEGGKADKLCPHWPDLLPLAAIFAFVGRLAVPRRIDPIWYDPEFTGWVAPIARRMAQGQVLYADGGHLPVPPLSYVLMRLLFGTGADWFDESLLNFLFQSALVVTGYLALSRWLPRPLPLVAAIAAAGYYFALPKSIVYDAMAQFFAGACLAAAGWGAAGFWRPEREHRPLRAFALAGACFAALALTKQSTALGCAAGLGCLILFLRAPPGAPRRFAWIAALALGFLAALAALAALATPFVSWTGFLTDAIITGGEPKRTNWWVSVFLLSSFVVYYAFWIVFYGTLWLALFFLAAGGGNRKPWLAAGRLEVPGGFAPWGLAAGLLAAITCFCLPKEWMPAAAFYDRGVGMADFSRGCIAPMGYAVVTWLAARALLVPAGGRLQNFGLLCLAALLAACSHNLSDLSHLRFTYDNNPVAAYAVAALLAFAAGLISEARLPAPKARAALAAACFAAALAGWLPMIGQAARYAEATENWQEIAYLDGGRMPARAEGLRALAALVRKASASADTVLLLPEDPDIEAWWQRPRPRLAGAVIFTDMYWPRYLGEDTQRLLQAPPKLIVIGPRNLWPIYSGWYSGVDGDFIGRIRRDLLPRRYKLVKSVPMQMRGHQDFMDVYARVDRHG
jgi:hypothetical protein